MIPQNWAFPVTLFNTKYNIGYCDQKHDRYLKEYRPAVYERLALTEELPRHLFGVDTACNERMEYHIKEIAKREGATEALKRANPMTWVGYMNNICNRAEEIVLHDLVCAYYYFGN